MANLCGRIDIETADPTFDPGRSLSHMSQRGGDVVRSHHEPGISLCAGLHEPVGPGAWHQTPDGRAVVACDGDLYDSTSNDGSSSPLGDRPLETIAAWYRDAGPGLFARLEGSFAIALWDRDDRKLHLATDHIGSKPLFYSATGSSFVFASEITGLIPLLSSPPRINLKAVDCFLAYGYVPAGMTMLEGVMRLEPSSTISVSDTLETSSARHAQPLPAVRPESTDFRQLGGELRKLLRSSLQSRLGHHRRHGYLLSGGVDTAALAAAAHAEGHSDITTFTLGFHGDHGVDERAHAREMSEHFRTKHLEIMIDELCLGNLPAVTRRANAPIGNPAAILSDTLFESLSGDVDSVVTGDGGNEIFGATYKYHQVMNFMVSQRSSAWRRAVSTLGQKAWRYIEDTALENAFQKLARLYFRSTANGSGRAETPLSGDEFHAVSAYYVAQVGIWHPENRNALYTDTVRSELAGFTAEDVLRGRFDPQSDRHVLQQMITVRTNSFIPYEVIPYTEPNAVAHRVQPLFPLLDSRLIRFMESIPYTQAFGLGWRHFMESALAGDFMPSAPFRRPHKGFKPPMESWYRTRTGRELVWDHLSDRTTRERGLYRPQSIESLLSDLESHRRYLDTPVPGKVQPLADSVWLLVALESWLREMKLS